MASSTPTPSRHEGLAEFALAIGGLAIGTGEFATMGLLPDIAQGIDVSEPVAGHAISAYALGVVIGAPAFALLGARMPRRLLLILLMVLFAAGNLLSATMNSYLPLLAMRFISGLPHGAYFGVASLVAASIVPHDKRATAVGRVMLGLSIANIIGVPLSTWLGQWLGWRSLFVLVGVLAIITFISIRIWVPNVPVERFANIRNELTAFKNRQLGLTLLAAAIGFGGMFAFYTYITSTLTQVTHLQESTVPWLLCMFGIGNVAGNIVGGACADRSLNGTIIGGFLWSAILLALYTIAVDAAWSAFIIIFLIGTTVGIVPAMQTRLMDIGKKAQTISAALNHSAFNIGNANGAWLGGLAISAGFGYSSTGLVGSALALCGLIVMLIAFALERRPGTSTACSEAD